MARCTALSRDSPRSGWSVCARRRRKNSTFPDGPGSGLAVMTAREVEPLIERVVTILEEARAGRALR